MKAWGTVIASATGVLLLAAPTVHGFQLSVGATLVEVASADPVDVGLVELGARVERHVELRNVCLNAIVLKVTKKTCGCIAAVVSPERIGPGESAVLSFSTNAHGAAEPEVYGVTVKATEQSSTGLQRTQSIGASLVYQVEWDFVAVPQRLILRVVEGEAVNASVYLQHPADTALALKKIQCDCAGLRLSEPRREGTGDNEILRLDVTGFAPKPGRHDGVMSFQTNGPHQPSVTIPITLIVSSAWSVSVPGIVFNLPDAAETCKRSIRIKGPAGARKVERAVVRGTLAGVRVELAAEPGPGAEYGVKVTFDRAVAGGVVGEDAIDLKDGGGNTVLTIPVVVYSLKPQ